MSQKARPSRKVKRSPWVGLKLKLVGRVLKLVARREQSHALLSCKRVNKLDACHFAIRELIGSNYLELRKQFILVFDDVPQKLRGPVQLKGLYLGELGEREEVVSSRVHS